jgi:hypothetical protein
MIQAKECLGWQRAVGDSQQSHAETAMFRYMWRRAVMYASTRNQGRFPAHVD